MKRLLLLITLLCSIHCYAQVSKVSLQASGLTCSMCSNAIFKSLKTLSFVDNIDPDIKASTFQITFKPGTPVDFNQLKDKVEDAGYTVANFVVTINCKGVNIKADETVTIGTLKLKFINAKDQSLNGNRQVRILNKGFISNKEYKKSASNNMTSPDVFLAAI